MTTNTATALAYASQTGGLIAALTIIGLALWHHLKAAAATGTTLATMTTAWLTGRHYGAPTWFQFACVGIELTAVALYTRHATRRRTDPTPENLQTPNSAS